MQQLRELVAAAQAAIVEAQDSAALEQIRITYLGKKGPIVQQMAQLRQLAPAQRPQQGELINRAKQTLLHALQERRAHLACIELEQKLEAEHVDVTLPGRAITRGGLHPVTRTIERIETFFSNLGFTLTSGPEVENVYYNFDALNIPSHHPARTEHDTFWIDSQRLLRTQTSNIQIRTLQQQSPPVRVISAGRVYRNDSDPTHTPMFHQVEGLMVDQGVNMALLKGLLHDFLCHFFSECVEIRFRPSYFPFTEPSMEVDIQRPNHGWLEVLGAGMVHPQVLQQVGIDPEHYSGFAFGMGVERLALLRYGIADLRMLFENDIRFLSALS